MTDTPTTSLPASQPLAGDSARHRTRAMATAGAVVAAVAVWAAFRAAGVEPQIPVGPGRDLQVLGIGPVLAVSTLSGLAGWAFVAVIERVTRRPRRIWTAVATGVFLVSLLPVTTVDGGAEKVALWLMHAAVAAVLVPAFRSTLADAPRP